MERGGAGDLYRRFGPAIYRRCLKLLRDPADAEDATQEVFVRAFVHLERHTYGSPLPWLYEIATRLCLNRVRDQGRRAAARERLPAPPPTASPADLLSDRDLASQLLEQVDERTALIAVYHVVDGMTQDEVARAVKLSRRTVGTRLHLFLERARRFLERTA